MKIFGLVLLNAARATTTTAGGTSGTIEVHDYGSSHDDLWIVQSDCALVHLESTHFDTESEYDYVTIQDVQYTGPSGVVIDLELPGAFNVSFTTDGTVHHSGFVLEWEGFNCTQYGFSGTIDHWLPEDANYTDYHNEEWNIQSNCGDGVHIWSEEFATEDGYDFLHIEGSAYHGQMTVDQIVPNDFSVYFTSDYDVDDFGFLLHWECVVQTGLSGQIDHLLWNYTNNHDQRWEIDSDCQNGVRLVSTHFVLEEDYDTVTIEGEAYHGEMEIDIVVNNSFSVDFASDMSITDDGFFFTWICYSAPLTGLSGQISLRDYENDHSQYWAVESGCSSVKIWSTHFEVEEDYDMVTIEGQEWHGNDSVVDQVVDGTFEVRFDSDGTIRHTGFDLEWECENAPLNNLIDESKFDMHSSKPKMARKFERVARRIENSPRCPFNRIDEAAFEAKMIEIWDVSDFGDIDTPMQELIEIRFTATSGVFPQRCLTKKGRVLFLWNTIFNNVQNSP